MLADALVDHLNERIRDFADSIQKNAESVGPRIREASEGAIRRRLEAIESSLQVASEGQKEKVEDYLKRMIALLQDFATGPALVSASAQPPGSQTAN